MYKYGKKKKKKIKTEFRQKKWWTCGGDCQKPEGLVKDNPLQQNAKNINYISIE